MWQGPRRKARARAVLAVAEGRAVEVVVAAVHLATGSVGYSLQVWMSGTDWGAPVAQGAGQTPTTVIALARPVQTRFVRITQTGTAAALWSVQQLRIFEMKSAPRR